MKKKASKKATPKKPEQPEIQPEQPELKPEPQEVPVVQCVNPQCPKCGSTERSKKTRVRRREISGTATDGAEYSEIVWSYVRCKSCKRTYSLMEFRNPVRTGGQ